MEDVKTGHQPLDQNYESREKMDSSLRYSNNNNRLANGYNHLSAQNLGRNHQLVSSQLHGATGQNDYGHIYNNPKFSIYDHEINNSEEIWDLDSNTVKRYSVLDSQNVYDPYYYNNYYLQQQNNYDAEWVQIHTPLSVSVTNSTTPSPTNQCNISLKNDSKKPKSYQCEPCDKWFTSSGHLKRHYNTTLHRNALRTKDSPLRNISSNNSPEHSEDRSSSCSSSGLSSSRVISNNTSSISTSHHLPMSTNNASSSPDMIGDDYTTYDQYNNLYPTTYNTNNFSYYTPFYSSHSTSNQTLSTNTLKLQDKILQNSSQLPTVQTPEYRCSDCNKSFNKLCYLKQHNKSFHNGEKPYKCNQCGKRFPVDVLYQEHLAKHAGDKPYKCEVCPKQFNHKTDLRRHMCLHTGEKPFSCDVCGKGFIREDRMIKHSETHKKKQTPLVLS
ncbi:uncharacterized protein [Lepeophtheirus salmonis]|uniref:uncharacterized protein n=1 Tax=Lepeophtheirus salmonis TaxID=72036 RepID=UPI001AEB8539|nr:zinc finger protein 675-like [Lepeophtheirus salmonis]